MNPHILPLRACPECRGPLALTATARDGDEVISGALGCAACARSYAIRNGIPRFVDGDAYAASFSLQWQRFRQVQLDSLRHGDETRQRFVAMTGTAEGDLAGRRVLEIGCGPGKFIETVVGMGAEAFGVDISFAVDAARENFGARPDVHLIRADVFKLPFVDGVFDLVCSLGVLHHTPDCRLAYAQLPRLAAPGERVAIWVYAQEIVPHFNRRLRSITRRMPSGLLCAACLSHTSSTSPTSARRSTASGPTSSGSRGAGGASAGWIRMKVDKMSMAASIEARAPFLDHRVVEFACRLPSRAKLGASGEGKWILRRAMDGLLPPLSVERRKHGFDTPLRRWLLEDLRGMVNDLLSSGRFRDLGIIRSEGVALLWEDVASGAPGASRQMWSLLCLAEWARAYRAGGIA